MEKLATKVVLSLCAISIFLISKDFILFWDTIQFAGYHPLFYYENDFSHFFLPIEIDSGHFPIFGMYIAAIWKLLGKSLWASHLAMLPFVFFCLWNAYRLGTHWTSERFAWSFSLLLLCMPQSIGQFMLVSPDVVLLAAFLGLIVSLEKERQKEAFIWATLLGLISNRGMIMLMVVLICQLVLIYRESLFSKSSKSDSNGGGEKSSWMNWQSMKKQAYVLPALSIFLTYQLLHLQHSGWIGYSENMSWATSFGFEDFKGLIKNFTVYMWRLFDFNAVIIWMLLIYFIWKKKSRLIERYSILLLLMVLAFGMITIPFNGLMQHRYFLPIVVLATFMVLKWTFELKEYTSHLVFAFALLLISGNAIVYPDKIAQGWDSTLAHIPYYSLQSKAIHYIDSENIPFDNVATAFPLRTKLSALYLNDDARQFQNKDEADTEFILYSNVMNDFSGREIEILKAEYKIVQEWNQNQIRITLYRELRVSEKLH